ncbi:MAG: hypothetical protein LKJ17_10715 [Oscillospiraceae bacterium]|jgi:uncharacterized protein YukE|nr:hypothetical protein [Oscillospiraceae bacterium]
MAVESITAASSGGIASNSCQSEQQDQISELVRLEQDVQRLKSNYKDKAKTSGMSQREINSKIRKYEKLIAKIEQEIRQIKRKVSSQPVETSKEKQKGKGAAARRDSTVLSMAALKGSYRRLVPAPSSVEAVSKDSAAELKVQETNNLDQTV